MTDLDKAKLKAIGLVLVMLAMLVGCAMLIYRSSERSGVVVTVTKAERVTKGKESYYLVWSKEGPVYTVSDSWSFMKFDSSDRYGRLEVGKTYICTVAGWRWHFGSWYENILTSELKEVER